MKHFRWTKLPKFRIGAENVVRRNILSAKILTAEILSDKVSTNPSHIFEEKDFNILNKP